MIQALILFAYFVIAGMVYKAFDNDYNDDAIWIAVLWGPWFCLFIIMLFIWVAVLLGVWMMEQFFKICDKV